MEADPETLLVWLKADDSPERELQFIALEQLCMLVLISDNIDRCFEQYKPQLFLPALCDIFDDPLTPPRILEVAARALTYFLDVSNDCAKKIVSNPKAIRSMCACLQTVDVADRTNKDLAEQIIKVFERLCSREASTIYEQDGLRHVLEFINNCCSVIHKDSLQSALNVVVKLIGKIDPQNLPTLDQTIESLSKLLLHDDSFVADNALRCFATMADRFSRRNVDPEPLMRYGLKDVLLRSLHHVSRSSADGTVTHNPPNLRGITTNLSVVTGLLSTICRGSAKVTHDLLRSDLPDALESALCNGDERCVLDIMRFLDLLIGLLFEGRSTLVRPVSDLLVASTSSTLSESSTPTSDTTSCDQSQQQIIDYIRSRDLQAFVNHIEVNNIDVNHTDHVGQTILNWVAAFGTCEMIDYLCQRGADVNRGQRSSSLHYAACFGRPSVVRLLLKYGANVDLRDEDGRTALDRARERSTESHKEVTEILQSSHEWSDAKPLAAENLDNEQTNDNADIQLIYLERLLSTFCQLYRNTMTLSIKRGTLRLMSKLFRYATIAQIHQLSILTATFELLSSIMDTDDDDDDTTNLVLSIIKNLFAKDQYLFLEQFQYLGIISKITALVLLKENKSDNSQPSFTVNIIPSDVEDIVFNRPYVWDDYNFIRNRESLYIWNNSVILELSVGSNGWFRYFGNNCLSTMYSSGNPEANTDSSENRTDFIDKFQRLKQQVLDGDGQEKHPENPNVTIVRTILTQEPTTERTIKVGSWKLQWKTAKQLRIYNDESEQTTILEHDDSGFLFESNRRTRQKYKVDTQLNNELTIPWSKIEAPTTTTESLITVPVNKNRYEQTKQRTIELASSIHNEYLKNLSLTSYTRSILNEFKTIVDGIDSELNTNSNNNLERLFEKLKLFLIENSNLTTHELSSSGLVSVLLKIFHHSSNDRIELFFSTFLSNDHSQAFQILIRKLVLILESMEKFPLFLYDASFNYGLQTFSRRFRFTVQYKNEQQMFTDKSGKTLKIEPLTTIEQIRTFLASMVSKQWYDYSHSCLEFVKQIKSDGPKEFSYVNDFDENGILYWIGTNGKIISNYTNPCIAGLISVSSVNNSYSSQQLSDLVSHVPPTDDNDDDDDDNNEGKVRSLKWIIIDLGLFVLPSHFTIRYSTSDFTNWEKSLVFQLAKDTSDFVSCETSVVHRTNSSTATWAVTNLNDNSIGYRYIRIQQQSSSHLICMIGFEVYGQVLSTVDIRAKHEIIRSRSNRDDTRPRSANQPSNSPHHHSVSTPPTVTRVAKFSQRWMSFPSTVNTNQPEQTTTNRTVLDSTSVPGGQPNAPVANFADNLRSAIAQALTQLNNIKTLSENPVTPNTSLQSQINSVTNATTDENLSNASMEQTPNVDNVLLKFLPIDDSTRESLELLNEPIHQDTSNFPENISNDSKSLLSSMFSLDQNVVPTSSTGTENDILVVVENVLESSMNATEETNTDHPTGEGEQAESVDTLCNSTEENNKKNATNEDTDQPMLDINENTSEDLLSMNVDLTGDPSNVLLNAPLNIADLLIVNHKSLPTAETNESSQQQKPADELLASEDEDGDGTILQSTKTTKEQNDTQDDDDDDEDTEQPQQEDEFNEEFQEQLHGRQQEITQRDWDGDFVLKRQFSVLLPAFDGRPGRTNINAIQDIPVPTSMAAREDTRNKERSNSNAQTIANMVLYIRGPASNNAGFKEIDIEMNEPNATIFNYVQKLINPFPSPQRNECIKRIFEPTYTLIYTEKSQGRSKSNTDPTNEESLLDSSNNAEHISIITDILNLLHHLYYSSTNYIQRNETHFNETFTVDSCFHSKKLNNKILQQTQDSILIASSSLPSWTSWLIHSYTFLYPFETRQLYFRTTSFGTSRSIVWLQERREELNRTMRNANNARSRPSNENSPTDFRFGRLKVDRAVAIDRENILRDAMNLFHYHAKLKSKLEIQFQNEDGTGDGPTLEFYSLIADDLQKCNLGLWWNHDNHEYSETDYVRKLEGLFPVPYSQDFARLDEICNYFSLIGICFAKCLLDKYLIDMPLSISFLKLLCMKSKSDDIWYDGILNLNDLAAIEPIRGAFFHQLSQLIDKRNRIRSDETKTAEEKQMLCQSLKIENDRHESVDMEHLCLTFVYLPPSNTYGYQFVELIPNGSHIEVTIDNLDQYVDLSLQFIFRDGIHRQMDAFRNGFNQVFPLEHLRCFSPEELRLVLCGNQWPSWTLDDLLTYVEPSYGFTRESPGFQKFLNVMLALDGLERKSVVQFITGCSSLPPGGLANLRPHLSVARKVEADDNSYPSVNTCYHYLKLPDYSSEEILKFRLMTACKERSFYFN